MCANLCAFTKENVTGVVAVTQILLSPIYAISVSNKVKFTEAATRGVLYKNLLIKILLYSQENPMLESLLIMLQALSLVTLLKGGSNTGVFL